MTTIALRKYLVSKINHIEDDSVLVKIKEIVEKNEPVYELSAYQLQLVNEAREEYKNGNFSTQEEMTIKVEEWKNRK